MNQTQLLEFLNTINFSDRYWSWCERHPHRKGVISRWLVSIGRLFRRKIRIGRKAVVTQTFADLGLVAQYDKRDRSHELKLEAINGWSWSGLFVCHANGGLEFFLKGSHGEKQIGSNFAALAYDTKRLAKPDFELSPFKGPPPYPRPSYQDDPNRLKLITTEYVVFLREIMDAMRRYEWDP